MPLKTEESCNSPKAALIGNKSQKDFTFMTSMDGGQNEIRHKWSKKITKGI